MHGIVLLELKKYVVENYTYDTWTELLQAANLTGRVYVPTETYPDEEVVTLVVTAAKMTKSSVAAVLEGFGEFIVPDLVKIYEPFVKADWKTLDFLENTEDTIHNVVRLKNPGADPPRLKASRPQPDEVVIIYDSHRNLCSLAKGIVHGVAKHYGERIVIDEPKCMLMDNPYCEIRVKLNA